MSKLYDKASEDTVKVMAEYIWLDGYKTANIRGKTKTFDVKRGTDPSEYPVSMWGFDGSSTEQHDGIFTDCMLKPVRYITDTVTRSIDPSTPNIIVLCEVLDKDGNVHKTNTRAALVEAQEKYKTLDFWFGIEQEYTLMDGAYPLGWPKDGSDFPTPQGTFYCAAGADKQFGRSIVTDHGLACMEAGLRFGGINAEVMAAQWEYQIGAGDPVTVSDHLILARYMMERVAEKEGVAVSLHPKPREGEWNGSGCHTNFSTVQMREGKDWDALTERIFAAMEESHQEHIRVYGEDNDQRLKGKLETSRIDQFSAGESDRSASIRIPLQCAREKKGYLEDRRPASNIDPYLVTKIIMETVAKAHNREVTLPELLAR